MTERFNIFFDRLMGYEGGLGNDPDDHGGLTKYGISKKSYPDIDIANLTLERAKEICFRDYYVPLSIEQFADNRIAWQVFDFGFNGGTVTSAVTIQRILKIKQDGIIGKITLKKANLWSGKYPLYVYFMSSRIKHYIKLVDNDHSQMKFFKGWIFRAVEIPNDI